MRLRRVKATDKFPAMEFFEPTKTWKDPVNEGDKLEVGVFLARMQPLHKAHIQIIECALKHCKRVVVMLGSSNKAEMLRNPYTLAVRTEILKEALPESDRDRIEVFEIPDWGLENDVNEPKLWGRYFYYNVVSRAHTKEFTLFYNDGVSNLERWFLRTEVRERINYCVMDRDGMFDGLSATKIRNAFIEDDIDYIKKFCPASVVKRYDQLREFYIKVKNNPKKDFVMK